ncbi:MAG: hypothetical protein IJX23_00250 [Clostridia bacterium]|nr:hypothetical protein [Clostridia bacterium]
MKFTTFIAQNIRWNTNKNPFAHLWATTTTKEMLYNQLKALGERYYHERKDIGVTMTEFCLNDLALKHPTTECQKQVLRHFDEFWQRFLRLQSIFQRPLTFPSNGTTRLEQIASLIAKCTGFCVDDEELKDILHDCQYLTNLTEREVEYLPFVVELYRINYFCALGYEVFCENHLAEKALAKFLYDNTTPQLTATTMYAQAPYQWENLVAMCNTMGNSILCYDGQKVDTSCKILLYKCGRNVFDTFCQHQFCANCAYFSSDISHGKICRTYFLQDGCEVRKTTLLHQGKNKCKFVLDVPVECDGERVAEMDGALCFATKDHYVAVAIVSKNQIAKCKVLNDTLTIELTLLPNEQVTFDIVTIVGKTYAQVTTRLAQLNHFGATRPNQFCGQVQTVSYTTPLRLTPSSNCFREPKQKPAKRLNFTYQLGDDDVATFLDNSGHSATLLQGFVFGVGGEKVYSVHNGSFCQLNCGKFTLDGNITYQKAKSNCIVSHGNGKRIATCHFVPQKTLFYLPFERTSTVRYQNNIFYIQDDIRNYQVRCCGQVESFTTDAMEFSPDKPRYKLSGNITSGNCLAICFAKDFQCSVTINSKDVTPPMTPLVQESLVSTYLNYINGKEVFCLNNFVKRAHPLSLASIVYTNPQFVKEFLQKLWQNKQPQVFYDNCGRLQKYQSEWLFDLACVYYASLTQDTSFPTAEIKSYVNTHLLSAKCAGYDLAIQALCLKRASQIDGFDKVKCLVQLANITKQLSQNTTLKRYSQAIGVFPLENPTKEYLKDICNDCEIPKNWYYVSQLENLYGLHIVGASLRVCPTTLEDRLEEFALNFGGKRIYTTFTKGTVQAMTLNGTTCHQPFDPYSLKIDKNTLVVSY